MQSACGTGQGVQGFGPVLFLRPKGKAAFGFRNFFSVRKGPWGGILWVWKAERAWSPGRHPNGAGAKESPAFRKGAYSKFEYDSPFC